MVFHWIGHLAPTFVALCIVTSTALIESAEFMPSSTFKPYDATDILMITTNSSREVKEQKKNPVSNATLRHILHFSDVHLNISESLNHTDSTKYIPIAYGNDAPITLLVSALDYAKKVLPDPDFFLYTGDHVVHGNLSEAYLVEAVNKSVTTLGEYYSTSNSHMMLDITAIIGNADTSPDYTMKVTNPDTEENPSIALISGAWNNTMTKSNFDWFNHRGYLAYALDDILIVITLNTLPYSPSHVTDTPHLPDPFEQFAWLDALLCELRSAGKFVYIVGHIPPIIDSNSGSPMWNETYIKTYKRIVSQNTDIIKAQFFGHVHSIEFRLRLSSSLRAQVLQDGVIVNGDYNDSSQLVPLFMAAAISPIYLNNPAFIVWDFDDKTYEILDFTVYGGNISSATGDVNWKPLFTASKAYGVSSLNTSQLACFVKRVAGTAKLLEHYYFNSKAQSRLQMPCRDVSCQTKWLCSLYWWSTVVDNEACITSTMAAKFKSPSAIQLSTSTSLGSPSNTLTVIIVVGIPVTAACLLLAARTCRRHRDHNDAVKLQCQRVHFAAIV